MLISLMLLIIVDRGIYLRKNVVSKLIFQYLLVLAVHIWIFFALPGITDKFVEAYFFLSVVEKISDFHFFSGRFL